MSNVQLIYGTGVDAYSFTPVPFFNISKEFNKTADGTIIGTTFTANVNGTLVSDPTGGLVLIDNLQDALRRAFAEEGKRLRLTCDNSVVMEVYPRLAGPITFEPSNNNWVFTSPFSMTFEWDEDPVATGENSGLMPPFVSEATEEWTIEFLEDRSKYSLSLDSGLDTNPYQLRLNHTVSAKGKKRYTENGLTKPAWQWAQDYVIPLLGYDSTKVGNSGTLNLNAALFTPYNHVRSNTIDEAGGTFQCAENWIIITPNESGVAGRALEDFTVNIRKSPATEDLTFVSVEGTVRGLESRDYGAAPTGFTITEYKYDAALAYWNNIKDLRIYQRAVTIVGLLPTRTLNSTPVSYTIGHNPPLGEITYNYEFNDRPSNCITGALAETFVITDTNPTDLFASLLVLGRSAGPVLQDLGTVTSFKRQVDIDVTVAPPSGCPHSVPLVVALMGSSPKGQVATIMTHFENQLKANYSQVFRTQDTERWEPKSGHFAASVEWTCGNCPS